MKNQVFVNSAKIETQTLYHTDGNINIYPCSFDGGHQIVAGATTVSQKGRMKTMDDGTSHFMPYAVDSGNRYNTLFMTAHGEVKETKSSIIISHRYAKKLGKARIEELHKEECDEMQAWIKTRKTQTNW